MLNKPSRTNTEERNKPYTIIPPDMIVLAAKGTQLNDFRESLSYLKKFS